VTASGALVKCPLSHSTLYRASIDDRVVRVLVRAVCDAGFDSILYGDTFDEGFDFYCPRIDDPRTIAADFFQKNQGCARVLPDLVENPPQDIVAGFALGTKTEMLDLAARLHEVLPGELYLHVLRSPRYLAYMCEISRAGVTKWSSILRLADQWGIKTSQICAVGDDVNDIPMVQGAGLGVAMGNAQPELLQVADRIAPSLEDEGLATVVDWILTGLDR
jgi:hydroxymethylpyrimidine pyrophosphatase-like HAD family hydrolase